MHNNIFRCAARENIQPHPPLVCRSLQSCATVKKYPNTANTSIFLHSTHCYTFISAQGVLSAVEASGGGVLEGGYVDAKGRPTVI